MDLGAAQLLPAYRLNSLEQQAAEEIELDRKTGAAVQGEARNKARAGEEGVGLVHIAVDKQILPRDEHVVQNQDGVVFVQTRGQGIVKRAAHGWLRPVRRTADR